MDGVEVRRSAMVEFVVFDYDEARNQGEDAGAIKEGVDGCAGLFLFGGVCGLEDENALSDEEDAGCVDELQTELVSNLF